jgi:anti-sigma factor RsiW
MSDLDPAEMSALLDGELDPSRARQVEALIAADPALAAQFEQLKRADHGLRSLAEAAAFAPEVRLPAVETPAVPRWLGPCLALLVTAWTVGKVTPSMLLAFEINALALVLFVICLMPFALREVCDPRQPV